MNKNQQNIKQLKNIRHLSNQIVSEVKIRNPVPE